MMCTRVCDSLKISYYCSPKLARVLLLKHKCCDAAPRACRVPCGASRCRRRGGGIAAAVAVRKDDGGAINLPLDGGCLLEWNLVVYVSLVI